MDQASQTRPPRLERATPRMRLVALDAELARLQTDDRPGFFQALDVAHEATWPPELPRAMSWDAARGALEADPGQAGWRGWVFIMSWSMGRGGGNTGRLAGLGGFNGPPDADGNVEIGYAMLPSFREQGLATEAVDGLMDWAFEQSAVRTVTARTEPDQTAPQRVLEKTGFTRDGEDDEGRPVFARRR